MSLPSASRLQRAFICTASAVLPHVNRETDQAARGTSIHEYLAAVAKHGRDAALALVPEEYRDTCEAIELERLPLGAEYMGEVALAYNVETEGVRLIGFRVERNYGAIADNEIAMSLDVLGVTPDRVLVGDFKTGHGRVTAAARNWQLRIGALAAARWKGVDAATVALIHIGEDGVGRYDSAELDAFDLMTAASDLRVLAKRIEVEREYAAGPDTSKHYPLRAVLGEHCKYCPAFTACPAQTNLIRRMAGEPELVARDIQALLTPETAAKAYERLRLVQETLKQVNAALYAYASEQPIQLADGHVFGPVEKTVERLDALVTRQALAENYGAEVADAACDFETSKAGVARGLRLIYEARKKAGQSVTLKALNEEALDLIAAAGGVESSTRTEVREHKPKS